MLRPVVVGTVAFVCGLVAVGAHADDRAEGLIRQAVELRRNGDDAGAYPLLVEAHTLSHSARSAAQRGLCEQALGRWLEAEAHVTEALKATNDPWVKKSRSTLEASLVVIKTHIGRVDVAGEPAGAEVVVNGTSAGRLPLSGPVAVAAGDVDIEVRASGYARATRTVRVDGGGYKKVELRAELDRAASSTMAATGAAAATPPTASAPASASTSASTSANRTAGLDAPAPSSAVADTSPAAHAASVSERDAGGGGGAGSARRAAKWIGWGAGVASLGLGIYGFARQDSAGNDFDGSCGVDPATGKPLSLDSSKKTDQQCADLKARVDSGFRLEVIGLIGAAVLGAAGLALWLTEPERKDSAAASAFASCAPGLTRQGGPWIGCLLRF